MLHDLYAWETHQLWVLLGSDKPGCVPGCACRSCDTVCVRFKHPSLRALSTVCRTHKPILIAGSEAAGLSMPWLIHLHCPGRGLHFCLELLHCHIIATASTFQCWCRLGLLSLNRLFKHCRNSTHRCLVDNISFMTLNVPVCHQNQGTCTMMIGNGWCYCVKRDAHVIGLCD